MIPELGILPAARIGADLRLAILVV